MSRRKGQRGERATATEIRAAFPDLADAIRRGWQARSGADDADIVGLPGYWIESKCGHKPNVRAALKQAIEEGALSDSRTGRPARSLPLVVVRDDRKEPFAVMRWPDLLDIIARLYRAERMP